MARPNHIPQFGNWDENDHMPYTTVFANARASKGGKTTNPNDPLENPEAFYGVEKNPKQSSAVNGGNPDEVMPESHPQHQRRASREDVEFGQGREFPSTEDGGRRIYSRHERRPSRDDGVSNFRATSGDAARRGLPATGSRDNGAYERVGGESPYQNPGPGHSPLHPQAQGRLGRKLGSASPAWERRSSDGGAGFAPGTPGRVRSDKGAPLPKFGEWDANNPASGDGFTMIFDKARDERKAGGAVRIPALQAESPLQSGTEVDSRKFQAGPKESKPSSWLACCFQPNAVQ